MFAINHAATALFIKEIYPDVPVAVILGFGLYEHPAAAFAFETIYGIFCWWVYGGNLALFWTILIFNLANASSFVKTIPGPEKFLAHKPMSITAAVALQIIVTAVLVGLFSRN